MKIKLLILLLIPFISYGQLSSPVKTDDGASLIPAGVIWSYGGTNAPTGWLMCDGSAVGTNSYPVLFTAIGTNFGSNGTNFNLPDMRGVFPKGAGTTDRTAGKDAKTNAYSSVLGSYYQDKM